MFSIRSITPSDLDLICRHRRLMFEEAGNSIITLDAMATPFREWLKAHLSNKTYFGFIAEEDAKPIAGIGMMEMDWPPSPPHPLEARRGYIFNVFVEPSHRRRGIASRLMEAAEREFQRRGLSYAALNASDAGRAMYQGSGWADAKAMGKALL